MATVGFKGLMFSIVHTGSSRTGRRQKSKLWQQEGWAIDNHSSRSGGCSSSEQLASNHPFQPFSNHSVCSCSATLPECQMKQMPRRS